LASGFAPVATMLEQSVNVGLGTDGAASNNRMDLFQEMRTCALLAKAVAGQADALPARKALSAATLGGARALGLEKSVGSLLPGKLADLCAVRLEGPGQIPCYDPVSHLVYACGRENVTHVWVEGVLLVMNAALVAPQAHDLDRRVRLWQNKLVLGNRSLS
jgi:5-methylthioadenosine/S-adenosylhomocysteine deaminase